MNAFVVEQLLLRISHQLAHFTISTADWSGIKSGPPTPEMTFVCPSTANIHYGPFSELQERPPLTLQITTRSVIVTHYGKYSELLEDPDDQLILDNDEIVGNVEDVEKIEDVRDAGKAKDGGGGKNIRDVEEARNARDIKDLGDAKNKEAKRGNN